IPWRSGVFLDDVFDADLKRLWYLYRRYGFEDAQIVDTRTDFDETRGTLVVTVVIEEGRQTIVRGIERVGVDAIAAALPKGQLAVGEPLDPEKVEAERQALVSAFGKAGYTRAEVTTEVHTEPQGETDAATVRFVGVSGTVQNVGAIIVQNNFDTRWRVIE